ncbi:helix-turn-helix domain-containing protein [Bifidobacterium leontopitheci]|nr:helix-turn-helix domain-containing protein [Bifidobacterium leontopitheci]
MTSNTQPTATPALIVNRQQAAAMLGVEAVTIDRWTARGELPVVRVPSTGKAGRPRNMYAVADIRRFIAEHTTTLRPTAPAAAAPPARRRSRRGSADLQNSSAAAIIAEVAARAKGVRQ